jgi:hypothetical protein
MRSCIALFSKRNVQRFWPSGGALVLLSIVPDTFRSFFPRLSHLTHRRTATIPASAWIDYSPVLASVKGNCGLGLSSGVAGGESKGRVLQNALFRMRCSTSGGVVAGCE